MIRRSIQRLCADARRPEARRGFWFGVAGTIAAAVIAGSLVYVSGVVPIKASSRHWPITDWLLHTGMKRSVATHTLGIKAPPLEDSDLILKGAGHYEIGCRPCHGSPSLPQPPIAFSMTPHPPYLPPRVGQWKPEELFYIVKHGVKFTAMPAWPAQKRDDEVWAMVAFLRKFPGLDEAAYRRLAYGESRPGAAMEAMEGAEQIPQAALQTCVRCHGRDGVAPGDGAFPNLAGQRLEYLRKSMEAYASGARHSGIMRPIAANLDAGTIGELSRYYANERPAPPRPVQDAGAVARGAEIARRGIPEQRVPSCLECHGAEGRRHKPEYPILAGQAADYLQLQLELFSRESRGGSEYAHLMHSVAPRLKPAQIRDVALYFESQPFPRTSAGDQ
jgi:cytochrome c553